MIAGNSNPGVPVLFASLPLEVLPMSSPQIVFNYPFPPHEYLVELRFAIAIANEVGAPAPISYDRDYLLTKIFQAVIASGNTKEVADAVVAIYADRNNENVTFLRESPHLQGAEKAINVAYNTIRAYHKELSEYLDANVVQVEFSLPGKKSIHSKLLLKSDVEEYVLATLNHKGLVKITNSSKEVAYVPEKVLQRGTYVVRPMRKMCQYIQTYGARE